MLDRIETDRTGEDRKARDGGVNVKENNRSDSPLLFNVLSIFMFLLDLFEM